jgi:hypothetical protein
MGKSMLIFIYDSVTSIKPKFHPKAFKFVEETHFGKASVKKKCNYSRTCLSIHMKLYAGKR